MNEDTIAALDIVLSLLQSAVAATATIQQAQAEGRDVTPAEVAASRQAAIDATATLAKG